MAETDTARNNCKTSIDLKREQLFSPSCERTLETRYVVCATAVILLP